MGIFSFTIIIEYGTDIFRNLLKSEIQEDYSKRILKFDYQEIMDETKWIETLHRHEICILELIKLLQEKVSN